MDLETRTCDCGCGWTFRCLPTSTARYANMFHKRKHEVMSPYAVKRRGRPRKLKPGEQHTRWNFYTQQYESC